MPKVAFITGTGRGIGLEIARVLLKEGYTVFGYSRRNIINHTRFFFIKIDFTNLALLHNFTFPKLEASEFLLVNNAGSIGEIAPISTRSEIEIIKEYSLNIITPTILCKKFLASYRRDQKTIINISSGAANNAIPSWSTYCASKAAMDKLTEVIVKEKHKNLIAFSVHPGVVDTDMQNNIRSADPKMFPLIEKFNKYYINNELESPRVVARKVLYIIQNKYKFKEKILSVRNINLNG